MHIQLNLMAILHVFGEYYVKLVEVFECLPRFNPQ